MNTAQLTGRAPLVRVSVMMMCVMMTCVMGLLALSAPLRSSAQTLETRQLSIRNGYPVPETLFLSPEQLKSIGWLYTGVARRFCTATIISYSAVITARHCFEDESVLEASAFGFALSPVSDTPSGEQLNTFAFSLSDVALHPRLDLAVVRFVGEPFRALEGVRVLPINRAPLEGAYYENLLGRLVSVAGFGETFEPNASGRYFASVRVELITGHSIVVNGERRQGICRGDSGGPLLAPGVDGQPSILAVVSKGDPCCAGVDQITRLDQAVDWLDELSGALLTTGPTISAWPEACRGVSQLGSCGDQELLRCTGSELTAQPCAPTERCDYDPSLHAFTCLPGCPGVPPEGTCLGNTLTRCLRGQTLARDCGVSRCMLIEGEGAPACVNTTLATLPEEEGGIPLCIDDEEERIREASEANFVASCAQHSALSPHLTSPHLSRPLTLFLALFLTLYGLLIRRLRRRALDL